jgi:hypothetical protein
MANYSLDDLPERAAKARLAHADYLLGAEERYARRCAWREANHILPIGVCGMGRAGKDTAAEYLCAHAGMVYPQSASWQALPIIAHIIGIPPEAAWADRHQHREFWINACHAFRGKDFGFLVRMCLGAGDIAVGIRGRMELDAVIRAGVVRLTVWVDNPRAPNDPTVEYGPGDCDLMVPNHGSILEFYAKLHKLLRLLRFGVYSKEMTNGDQAPTAAVRTRPD